MFELDPEWLDKYVRAFMKEVVAEELEKLLLWEQGKTTNWYDQRFKRISNRWYLSR